MLALRAGLALAEIAPERGGALASLLVDKRPVLLSEAGRPKDSPFALAMNLLLPFSNRVSGGGFVHEGRFHALEPNLPGEPFPIHGDAFQRSWDLEAYDDHVAMLRLADGRFGPFQYMAKLRYELRPTGLSVTLELVSTADEVLPFGVGFHPWFPRSAQTRLRFHADGVWMENHHHLPLGEQPSPLPPAWDWRRAAPLPDGWINAGFVGWDGGADIIQGEDAVPLRLRAEGLGTAILYSPSADAPFFCFEPVSHPVDAHNLPGTPGLVGLPPAGRMQARMDLEWPEIPC